MRTQTISLYTFEELPDTVKAKVIEGYRNGIDYTEYEHELDEGFASIEAFCEHFGVKVKECSINAFSHAYITTTAEQDNFRGIKLSSIDRDYMPTGYYLDCDLWETFHDDFKDTGNAKYAFECALEAAINAIQQSCESYYEDDSIIARLEANEYEFLECGEIYN